MCETVEVFTVKGWVGIVGNESKVLENLRWERVCRGIAAGEEPVDAYLTVFKGRSHRDAQARVTTMLAQPGVQDRLKFLTSKREELEKEGVRNGVDLKRVIRACQDIIEDQNSKPTDKTTAINTLDKLGVFDNETKDDGVQRMDPGAVCEYLATFAAHPASELARIPGGLAGLVKRLMELTGAKAAEIEAVARELSGRDVMAGERAVTAP